MYEKLNQLDHKFNQNGIIREAISHDKKRKSRAFCYLYFVGEDFNRV